MAELNQAELMQRLGLMGPQKAQAADYSFSQQGNGVQQPPVQPDENAPAQGPGVSQPVQTVPMQMITSAPGMPTKEERELRKRIEQQEANDITRREGDVMLDRQALQNDANRGGFAKADLTPLMQLASVAGASKAATEGYKAPVDNTTALRAALEKNQEGLATSQNAFLKSQMDHSAMQGMRQDLMQQRLNEKVYGGVITGVQKDPSLHDLVEKSNNISRIADVAFSPTQDINTTSLHDLQQTVTTSLSGLKGTGGVTERANRYMEDMNTAAAQLKQKFGDTNSIPRNEPILVHYMELARDGQKFLQDQAEKRLLTLAGGHENITNLPTYHDMLNQELDRARSNVIQPRYMNTGVSNASVRGVSGGPNAANARPAPMSESEFIDMYMKKKAANGQ